MKIKDKEKVVKVVMHKKLLKTYVKLLICC